MGQNVIEQIPNINLTIIIRINLIGDLVVAVVNPNAAATALPPNAPAAALPLNAPPAPPVVVNKPIIFARLRKK
jgi:hypothetical protein